jgi:hypothetical protein
MSIFRRPDYTSEVSQFIDALKAQKPTLEAEQRQGRAIWWDKKLTSTLSKIISKPVWRSSPTSTKPVSTRTGNNGFTCRLAP